MKENGWYIRLGAEELGPVSCQELRILAGQGALAPETPVSTDRSTWRDAATVEGLCFVPVQPVPSGARPAENAWLAAGRSQAKLIVNDLRHMDFRKEVMPLNANNLKLLTKDFAFWAAMLLGIVPLLIGTLADNRSQLTAFAIFFAVVWGVIFKLFVVRDGDDWKMPVAAMLFTGLVGTNVLLIIYQLLFPRAVLEWAWSPNPLVAIIGCVGQVGVCEEICKITPVLVYAFWKRSTAKPFTMVLVGVFSGLGFAAFENLRYDDLAVALSYDLANTYGAQGLVEGVQGAMVITLLRSLATVFVHAVMTGIFAYFLAAASVLNRRWGALFLVGLGIVALLHGVYDWLLPLQTTMAAAGIAVAFAMFCGYLTKLHGMIAAAQETHCPIDGLSTRLMSGNDEVAVG